MFLACPCAIRCGHFGCEPHATPFDDSPSSELARDRLIRCFVITPSRWGLLLLAHETTVVDCGTNRTSTVPVRVDARALMLLRLFTVHAPNLRATRTFGAQGGTRTPTPFGTATSTLRVYQFHHLGISNFCSWSTWRGSNSRLGFPSSVWPFAMRRFPLYR